VVEEQRQRWKEAAGRERSFNLENTTLGGGAAAAERASCQVNGTLGAIPA